MEMLSVASTSSGCQLHKTTCQPMKNDVTSQDILSQIYDVIQSDVALHLQVLVDSITWRHITTLRPDVIK